MRIIEAFEELVAIGKQMKKINKRIEKIELAIVDREYLSLKVDGKDEIYVEVESGAKFEGVVTKVETFGETFRIEGRVKA